MKKDEHNPATNPQVGHVSHNTFRRRLLPALVASCFACGPVYANPTGAQVVSGQVNISSSGNVLTVTNTPGSIINWMNFSIGAGQITQFLQQSSSSSVLNRIIGQNPTQIFGTLESNGRVFLINPNGILFEPGSQVNVGGLVASSLDISNTDFVSGKLNFSNTASAPGSVVNQGSITTPNGGSIYLIAPQVQNSGVMTSPQGEILLAAGHSVQLVDGADPNIQVVISSASDQVTNLGQVIAQGGKIGIYGALVNQSGMVSADSAVVGENGQVVFKSSQSTILGQNSSSTAVGAGSGGTVEVLGPNVEIIDNALINASGQTGGGKVMVGGDFHGSNAAIPDSTTVFIGADSVIKADAIQNGNGGKVAVWSDNSTQFFGNISAQGGVAGGNGGYVETSGKYSLNFDGSVNLAASYGMKGTLLLDPYSINITGNVTDTPQIVPVTGTPTIYISPVTSYIYNATLETQLGLASVLIETGATSGTITVSAPITWANSNSLSLVASSNININAAITAASGTLSLNSTGGNISQSAPIAVSQLVAVANSNASGYGNVSLTNSSNAIGTIAGFAGGTGGFQFTNSTATTVGSVTGYTNGSSAAINGITASAGNLQIQSGGALSITQPISTTGTAYLTATSGSITQSGLGTITAGNLYANAPAGAVTLGLYNSVSGTVTGNSSGAFQLISTPGFSVGGVVGEQSGITSAASVSLQSVSGSIVSSGSGAITAPTATIIAEDGIGVQGAPLNTAVSTITLVNGCNDGCEAGFGGGYDIVVANTGDLAVAGITQKNTSGSAPTSNIILTNNGNININGPVTTPLGSIGLYSNGGAVTVNSAVTAASGNIGITATGGAISIYAPITASGTVALQASGIIYESPSSGTISAGSLSAVSTGSYVSLTSTGNNVGVVAGSAAGSTDGGAGFAFTNGSSFSIGYVGAIGSAFSPMGNTNGITTTAGGIALATTGNITIAGPINAGTNYISIDPAAGSSISQASGGSITTSGTLYLSTGANIGASGAGNSILTTVGTLSVAQATDVYISDSGTGTMNIARLAATGVVNISTAGAMNIPASEYTYTGSSITLVSGGNMTFANNTYTAGGGAGAISLFAGYTEAPGSAPVANVTSSTLTQAGVFNGSPINLWANAFADFLGTATYSTTPSYHPTAAPIDIYVTGTAVSTKGYDTTTTATLTGGTLEGVPGADQSYVTLTQSGYFASKNAGTGIAVTATDVLNVPAALAGDFILVQPTGLTGTITPAQLTLSGVSASKIYDGTTNATLTGGTLNGIFSGDTVTLNASTTGQYATKNVGSNIAVTLTAPESLSGTDAGNYVLVQPTVTGTITPATLTVAGQSAASKVYDGTTNATLSGGTLTGVFAGDSVTLDASTSGQFASKNVGSNITVTASTPDALTGTDAGNYVLVQPTFSAAITPATLTVSGQTAANKLYDGTTNATLQNGTLVGVVAGDAGVVTLNQIGSFSSPNPGIAVPVIAADTLAGSGASNYTLVQPTGLTANITSATALTINPQTVQASETYIVALNTTVNNVGGSTADSDSAPPSTSTSGKNSSGGTSIINNTTGDKNHDGTSTKLYCN